MVLDRRSVNRSAGLTFCKLLGTGHGRTFGVTDADPSHWALLACWSDPRALVAFERGEVAARWHRRGAGGERLRVVMRPLASRGRWGGRLPFGHPVTRAYDGPIA